MPRRPHAGPRVISRPMTCTAMTFTIVIDGKIIA
jgi:hypothetical protein